jgi:sigma-B regulation protein RsbU (phosphoserine phosphatase)
MDNLTLQSPLNHIFAKHPIKVLMVDDQPIFGEAIRRMLENERDISFHFASNAQQALELGKEIQPTVILQDLVMPQVDGLMMVKNFRDMAATRHTPIIVLSSREESDIKSLAFAAGANDYVVKLPEKPEIVARIRYHSKAYINLLERNQAYESLLKAQALLKEELEEAAVYVRSIIPPKLLREDLSVDWIYLSSTALGGDTLGYHWMNADTFALYLIDVCGHGVRAALLSVSIINILRSHALLTDTNFFSPSAVLSELNEIFELSKQNQMYFTLWYGVYSKNTRTLTYASAGHPPAVLVKPDYSYQLLSTDNMVIGAFPKMQFVEERVVIDPMSRLYIFSDGVYELESKETQRLIAFNQFIDELIKPETRLGSKLNDILRFAQNIQGKPNFDDDFSLIETHFY